MLCYEPVEIDDVGLYKPIELLHRKIIPSKTSSFTHLQSVNQYCPFFIGVCDRKLPDSCGIAKLAVSIYVVICRQGREWLIYVSGLKLCEGLNKSKSLVKCSACISSTFMGDSGGGQ